MSYLVIAIIAFSLLLFILGKPRYDIVSLTSLLLLVIVGAVSPKNAFVGFSHGAVVTVAAALILSAGLLKTGLIDYLMVHFKRHFKTTSAKIASLMAITALFSSFMNNVAALALVMPMALSMAKDSEDSPSIFLMPIAAASLLGGLITEIGTPPNLLISSFRENLGLSNYRMFDFAPVGLTLTLLGILFTSLVGWRLVPKRKKHTSVEDPYSIEAFISEFEVTTNSTLIGANLKDLMATNQLDVNILSILRHGNHILAPSANECFTEGDILIVKAEQQELNRMMEVRGLKIKHLDPKKIKTEAPLEDSQMHLIQVVLKSESPLIGRTVVELDFRNVYNANLVAISKLGDPTISRLKEYRFQPGDVLLILIADISLTTACQRMRAIPLTTSTGKFPSPLPKWKRMLGILAFLMAIAVNVLGYLPIEITFLATALAYLFIGLLSLRELYDAIEWPIILMLGSLIPLGTALETSGAADLLAAKLLLLTNVNSPLLGLMTIMTVTLILTNLINNSAAVLMMAPIAIAMAQQLGFQYDPFLMGVCVAASSAYMTPIGHQSNTLIMGPGGFKFTDYWQLGLPISLISILAGAPLIALFWPL